MEVYLVMRDGGVTGLAYVSLAACCRASEINYDTALQRIKGVNMAMFHSHGKVVELYRLTVIKVKGRGGFKKW